MALSDGLVAYWKHDESSGNRADEVGTATLIDNGSVGSTTGGINNGSLFDATPTKYFSVTNSALNVQSSFSFSFFASTDNTGRTARVLTGYGGSNNGRLELFQASDGSLRIAYYNSGGSRTYKWAASAFPSTGVLYHFVVAVEASTNDVKIYRNGTSLTITNYQASASALGDNSGVYAMGGFVGGSDTWDGVLDEFGFWNRQLSGTEASDIYNSGSVLSYDDITGGPAPTPKNPLFMGGGL